MMNGGEQNDVAEGMIRQILDVRPACVGIGRAS